MVAWGRLGASRRAAIRELLAASRCPESQSADEWAERCRLLRPILADAGMIDAAAASDVVLRAACEQARDACLMLALSVRRADIPSVEVAFVEHAAQWNSAGMAAGVRRALQDPSPMPAPGFIAHSLSMVGTDEYRKAITYVHDHLAQLMAGARFVVEC